MTLKLNTIEIAIISLIALSLIVGFYFAFGIGISAFEMQYAVEDGWIEYGTALCLLTIAFFNIIKLFKYRQRHAWLWTVGAIVFALLFLFGAGEEISWGQRILGLETPDSLQEINKQDELNLHNIRIGDFDVNKLIFSKLLTIILIIYFVFYPILYSKTKWVAQLTNRFGVPVPQIYQTVVFLIATLLVLLIPSGKNAELHEFAFSATFLLIFLFPNNRYSIH